MSTDTLKYEVGGNYEDTISVGDVLVLSEGYQIPESKLEVSEVRTQDEFGFLVQGAQPKCEHCLTPKTLVAVALHIFNKKIIAVASSLSSHANVMNQHSFFILQKKCKFRIIN